MTTRLLTGATDGIGLELARLWRARGERPLLSGRREREVGAGILDESGAPLLDERYVAADLSHPGAPEVVARFLDEVGIERLDTLVLNAAAGHVGDLVLQDPAAARALLEVNLVAPLHLCRLLLPRLVRARGRVVFVSSIVAQMASPGYALYAAAKSAVEGFLRSLRVELAGRVEVQVLRLGAVRTRLHAKSGVPPGSLDEARFPSARSVAEAIDRAVAQGPRWRVLGLGNRAVFTLGRAWPQGIDRLRREPGTAGSAPVQGRPRVLVTGISGGIGAAIARRSRSAGFDVVGLDRETPPADLAELAVERADLSRVEGLAALGRALAARGPFAWVIHCAGLNRVGRFESMVWPEARVLVDVNLVAPVLLTLQLLRAAGERPPNVAFVSSLSRFVSYPGAAVYAATKDGLAHFARSLRARQRGRGSRVLTIYPGPTRTAHAREHSPAGSREDRRMAPEVLAERVLRAALGNRDVLVPGLSNQASALVGHLLPRVTEHVMRRAILDRL